MIKFQYPPPKDSIPEQTNRHTDKQTDGYGDSKTNSTQWGRVGEKNKLKQLHL